MKIIGISLVNSLLILLVVLIHKIFFRILLLGYENLVIYWGSFVLIYFILNLITNKILLPRGGIIENS
ncbi:TPA: bacteriocin-like WGxF protein [Listeria monocytogenes]|nr:bacteriocin-like WGxF protein [Listeria monocytogenes]HCW3249238.1 bacteriocin-like WGxF protein [Listeria monocytogenes]HCW3317801.1 bacteriocin-like WGxF protein [Listeria monocytogenes]